MSTPKQEYLVIGKIGSAYGVKGWVKVYSFSDDRLSILQYNPWYLADGDDWKAIKLEDGRAHGKGIVAKLEGYETPETVRLLASKEIAIKREHLAPLTQGEYYWADLEGLTVINQNNVVLGKIAYLMETGANDVIVFKDEAGKEHALPYLPGRVVKEIDLNQGVMHVDWDLI